MSNVGKWFLSSLRGTKVHAVKAETEWPVILTFRCGVSVNHLDAEGVDPRSVALTDFCQRCVR